MTKTTFLETTEVLLTTSSPNVLQNESNSNVNSTDDLIIINTDITQNSFFENNNINIIKN
jgi:hypothetical protein